MADGARGATGGLVWLSRFPWVFLVIGYLIFAQSAGLDMRGVPGYVFLGLGVVVLFVEFFKSGDISAWGFMLDIFWSVAAVTVVAVLLTHLYLRSGWEGITFFHWFGCAVVYGDALLSPFNSFRTGLRNIDVHG